MSTQHEVGQVPSETNNVDPLVPVVPPKHLNLLLVAVISFLTAPVGVFLAIKYNKKVTQHNKQIGATKVSAMNFWLTVVISAAIGITAAVATHLPQFSPANAPYIVIGTGPAAPQQPTRAVVVPAPDTLPTNPVETGSIQPVASTPEGIIRAVEAYRNEAYHTGDTAPLAYYFAFGNSASTDSLSQIEAGRIDGIKPQNLVGKITESVTKIQMISVTPSMMVAHVTIEENVIGVVRKTNTFRSEYVLVNNRWLVRFFAKEG